MMNAINLTGNEIAEKFFKNIGFQLEEKWLPLDEDSIFYVENRMREMEMVATNANMEYERLGHLLKHLMKRGKEKAKPPVAAPLTPTKPKEAKPPKEKEIPSEAPKASEGTSSPPQATEGTLSPDAAPEEEKTTEATSSPVETEAPTAPETSEAPSETEEPAEDTSSPEEAKPPVETPKATEGASPPDDLDLLIPRLKILEDGSKTFVNLLKDAPMRRRFKQVGDMYQEVVNARKINPEHNRVQRIARLEMALGNAITFLQTSKLAARFGLLREARKVAEETMAQKAQV